MPLMNDMTTGQPLKKILYFSIPMIIGGFFQQLYNVVDTIIVGNFVGSRALAAVGATTSATFFLLSLAMGLTNAFAIVVSQHFGAKDEAMVKKSIVNSVYITLLASLILSIAGFFGARPLMEMLQTPPDIIDDAVIYIQICIGFSFGLLAYNGAASVLRAVGDSKTPLYFLILSTVLNIVLDLVFVLFFSMGVMGVAVATVISQTTSAVLCILYMYRNFPIFRFKKKDLSGDKKNFRQIVTIGLSMSVQSIFISIGEMVVSGMVNSFGTNVVAAYTTGLRVEKFTTLTYQNLTQSFSVYAGQNLGAREIERIKEAFKKVILLIAGLSLLSSVFVFSFGDEIVKLFITEGDIHLDEIVQIADGFLKVSAVFYPFLGFIWFYNNTMRGMGEVRAPLLSGVIEFIVKVVGSIALGSLFGYVGVWFAGPLGWILGIIPSFIAYHSGKWESLTTAVTAR